jgi:ribosomal protein L12E/L44/L45/RPP1/RPP2
MSVVIDEVIAETGEPAPAPRAASSEASAPAAQPEDADQIAFEMGRRRHRLERLWAD